MAMTYWLIAQSFFNRVMLVNSGEGVHPFVKMAFDYAKEDKPAHKLSQWVSQCAWDFWNNQRALQSGLRQCPCCGSFFIPEGKRGRPIKNCSPACGSLLRAPSRDSDRERRKKGRKDQKVDFKDTALDLMIKNWYVKKTGGTYRKILDKKEAGSIFDNLKKKEKKDLDRFKNTDFFVLP